MTNCTVYTFEVARQYPVTIQRNPRSKYYTLMYGKQTITGLTYEEATKRLGEYLMHAIGCNGFHNLDGMEG